MRGAAADWHNAAAYTPLHRCDRAMFAWEWLRRDAAYRAAYENRGDAAAFGLVRFEPPSAAVSEARPMWRADIDPSVLVAQGQPSTGVDAFDLRRFGPMATSIASDAHHHVLLTNGHQALRLDLPPSAVNGPFAPRWQLPGLASLIMPLDALRSLVFLYETGRFPARMSPTSDRARRWAILLRVFDARLDGATAREIAEALFGPGQALSRWRIDAADVRARVQRLIIAANKLAVAGPPAILAGAVPAAGGRRIID